MTEDRRQRTDDPSSPNGFDAAGRGQRSDVRGQRAEIREQRAEGSGHWGSRQGGRPLRRACPRSAETEEAFDIDEVEFIISKIDKDQSGKISLS